MKKILFFTVLAIFIAGMGYWRFLSPVEFSKSAPQLFQIDSGLSLAEIGRHLEKQRLIRSDTAFVLYAKIRGIDTAARQGRYRLSPDMDIKTILEILTDPQRGTVSVTIPEGFTITAADRRLGDMGLILPGEFSSAASGMEGFLFPDTYAVFSRNFDPQDLIEKMRGNFLKKITPELLKEIEKRKRTLPQVITMASILEKEVRTEKDYAVVAGILWKRLDHDWPLQADATLLYGKSTRTIGKDDLEADSPYNTRKFKGLPPTPIGNPGLATIRAAVFPQDLPYWFYLTDKNGDMHYAVTNEEHNENRRKYL